MACNIKLTKEKVTEQKIIKFEGCWDYSYFHSTDLNLLKVNKCSSNNMQSSIHRVKQLKKSENCILKLLYKLLNY